MRRTWLMLHEMGKWCTQMWQQTACTANQQFSWKGNAYIVLLLMQHSVHEVLNMRHHSCGKCNSNQGMLHTSCNRSSPIIPVRNYSELQVSVRGFRGGVVGSNQLINKGATKLHFNALIHHIARDQSSMFPKTLKVPIGNAVYFVSLIVHSQIYNIFCSCCARERGGILCIATIARPLCFSQSPRCLDTRTWGLGGAPQLVWLSDSACSGKYYKNVTHALNS